MAHLTGHILNSNGKFRYLGEYNWQNLIGYYFYITLTRETICIKLSPSITVG